MDQTVNKKETVGNHRLLYAGALIAMVFLVLVCTIAIVPAVSPAAGAQMADLLRSVFGPQPVADIESISFWAQDNINQLLSKYNGGKLQLTIYQTGDQSFTPAAFSTTGNALGNLNVVTSSPQIGWQAYGPSINGSSTMALTLLTLDPQRSYAAIALVRIDLSKLQLHIEPGFLEPSHTAEIQKAIPNLGSKQPQDQQILMAAFNGGFKAVNGNYGMMVNGVTLLPPLPNIATLGIYKDGHVQIGAWGESIFFSPDLVAYRQNCPLILQDGQLNQAVSVDDRFMWGQTIGNKEVTWRTAVGITQDGKYLIYAVGNATTTDLLAKALQQAGAFNAMQLDINRHYAQFVTYKATDNPKNPLTAIQLLDQMEKNPMIYLVPHSRDFFYLTSRQMLN
jgi:hypothetical protein